MCLGEPNKVNDISYENGEQKEGSRQRIVLSQEM